MQEGANYNMRKNTYIIKPRKILEDEIIPLYYDFIFCQIFGNKKYGFALNKLLAELFNQNEKDIADYITYLSDENYLCSVNLMYKYNGCDQYVKLMTDTGVRTRLDGIKNTANSIIKIHFQNKYTNRSRMLAICVMRDEDGIVDTEDDNVTFHISMGLSRNSSYKFLNKREENIQKWCQLFTTNSLLEFRKLSETLLGKENGKILTDAVYNLSHNKDNIDLYSKVYYRDKIKELYWLYDNKEIAKKLDLPLKDIETLLDI